MANKTDNKNTRKNKVIRDTITNQMTKTELLSSIDEIHKKYLDERFTLDSLISLQHEVVSLLKEIRDNEAASAEDVAYILFRFNRYISKIENNLYIKGSN